MINFSQSPEEIKSCCAALYESDWARLLLGESFHPGGLALTERLGHLLALSPAQRVLDVASGHGVSAIFLAERFGCEVVGVDYGVEVVRTATDRAEAAKMAGLVRFVEGDAECLNFDDNSFDVIICECAFCTFPHKQTAADEFARILRPGGKVGLSDLTRTGSLPRELDTLLAWLACIADAHPLEEYATYLERAHLTVEQSEPHNEALTEMIRQVQGRLLSVELMLKLGKLKLPEGVDLDQAKMIAKAAVQAGRKGKLGYSLLTARKPAVP